MSSAENKSVPDFGHLLKDGWFSERNRQWPGQALSLQVDEVLFDKKSDYQHVMVLKSANWGNVLILDGVIQLTTRDESSYQEMIAHLPLYSHSCPENVLIVGGGDGGVVREVVKHSCVKSVHICEIDKMVIEVGKKYFPSVASAWDDKRVKLITEDAAKYIASDAVKATYDVIIVDSSDPDGPAEPLFEEPFFLAMEKALRPGGRISTQAESIWLHLPLIKKLLHSCSSIFAAAEYATTQIPTYPCGQIGFLLLSKAGSPSPAGKRKRGGASQPTSRQPARHPSAAEVAQLNYYTSDLHSAAFVLPAFVQRTVDAANEEKEKDKKEKADKAEKAENGDKAESDAVEDKKAKKGGKKGKKSDEAEASAEGVRKSKRGKKAKSEDE